MSQKEPKYIDTHAHVNFSAFDADREEVVKRALENDTWMINVGTQIDTSKSAVELAEKYDEGVYAIVGLHPIHSTTSHHDEQELGSSFAKASGGQGRAEGFVSRGEIFNKDAYRELLKSPKVVGVGECGLDYYRLDVDSVEKQKKNFIAQIELANEFNKPLMLHIRNNPKDESKSAYMDALKTLKQYSKVKGNVHFFTGTLKEAQAYTDFGFTLSFTGVVTFTHDYDEVIKSTPLDMILSETDCPYVSPVPYRGKRNEPLYVQAVVKKIAEIKGLPENEASKSLFDNAGRVFGI